MLSALLWFFALSILFYKYFIYPLGHWRRKNIPQGRPLPIFGDQWTNVFKLEANFDLLRRLYNTAKGRYYGIYQMTLPHLLIKDPELVKKIAIKDFEYFVDHRPIVPALNDPLWSKNLLQLQGEEWRTMRATLSPTFTGSKMRAMFVLMKECTERYIKFYQEKPGNQIEVEMKDSTTRFGNDVVASCAFGIDCDSLKYPNNDFFLNGKDATNFNTTWRTLRLFIMMFAPKFSTFIKMRFFTKQVGEFFTSLMKETIKIREEKKIIRPDMIHLLMEARNGKLKYEEETMENDAGFATVAESYIGKKTFNKSALITDVDVTSQALIFFFAGFDTVATTCCFLAYELAINPDIQTRLRNEIDSAMIECNNEISYNHLMTMKYLDMVVSETFRKWPAFPQTDRLCVKDYVIPSESPDETTITIKKGERLLIPISAFHRDPKYYPDPDKFDPERFNEINKHKIDPFTYFPFGLGPRACIGTRFALLQIKILFFYLLLNFEVKVIKKTQVPLKLNKTEFFNLAAEGSYWLGWKKRNL